jgi:ABC-type glycerol-3-phosphate transport system substrate-binding protein
MYDPLYTRLAEFEVIQDLRVETVVAPTHPDLNEQIEAEFASGGASYDLISTHTKYAPSQKQWLTPLDDDLDEGELEPFIPRTLELARIDGSLFSIPRNLDVKLLLYRTDFMQDQPSSWEALLESATRLRSDNIYGFAFPARSQDSSATSSSCRRWPEARCSRMKVRPRLAWTTRQAAGRSGCSRTSTRGPRPLRRRTGTTTR